MSKEMLEKWRARAMAVESPRTSFGLPTHVFLGEAIDLTAFVQNYWESSYRTDGGLVRPGLSSVNSASTQRLEPNMPEQLRELQGAAHHAQLLYKLAVSPDEDLMGEAETVLGELTAIVEFYYDDGQQTVEDVQLERLSAEHASPASHDAMALALDDYAAIIEPIRSEVDGVAGFDAALIDRARVLASKLREKSAPTDDMLATKAALQFRNQVWTLLYDRMLEVRRTAKVVFRNHPEVLRLSVSNYQRRKQAEYRRRRASEREAPVASQPGAAI